ncbi:hypothetical protein M9H77_06841 [Catharanthus roseus]|uniref:Uncharacterized protein n=1 Tax=Catharanthus roseus TaxID=4058 RepID=A0ACC0BTC4_CATRO|nr:hypothetical protein M9H77_06841 [Catharanthus roseus]
MECPARICVILRDNGMWQVSKIVEQYNHELYPSMSRREKVPLRGLENVKLLVTLDILNPRLQEGLNKIISSKFKQPKAKIKKRLYYNQLVKDDNEEIGFEEENLVEEEFEKFRILETVLLNNFGLLCAHTLKVTSIKRVNRFPERYVLQRWRKNVHRRHLRIFFDEGYPHMIDDIEKIKDVEKYDMNRMSPSFKEVSLDR